MQEPLPLPPMKLSIEKPDGLVLTAVLEFNENDYSQDAEAVPGGDQPGKVNFLKTL